MNNVSIKLKWEVENNIAGEGNNKYFFSSITLVNNGQVDITNSGWKLYFNYIRVIYFSGEDEKTFTEAGLKVTKYSGSLYKFEPLENWKVLNPGDSFSITFKSSDWAILKSDAPLGAHLQLNDNDEAYAVDVEVGEFVTSEQTKRYIDDNLGVESPETRYKENEELLEVGQIGLVDKLLPRPEKLTINEGVINFKKIKSIYTSDSFQSEIDFLTSFFPRKLKVVKNSSKQSINIVLQSTSGTEGSYTLSSSSEKNSIDLVANSRSGIFYGLVTLKQLIFLSNKNIIDSFHIEDAPRFGYRGLMLDVSRHYQKKETIIKMLDLMAAFKLNKLHLHFCDDEGWRIEIKSLPELTSYGSKRGFDPDEKEMLNIVFGSGTDKKDIGDNIIGKDSINNNFYNFKGLGSGFYSEDDFIEILKYAKTRNIEVIPEIDVPGHCRAAIKSMEYRFRKSGDDKYRLVEPEDKSEYMSIQLYNDNVINPCLDSTYNFLKAVVIGIQRLFNMANADLNMIHIGGDEVPSGVWEKSPACIKFMEENNIKNTQDLKDYFFKRFIGIIKENTNATVSGWDDIVMKEGSVKEQFVNSGFTSMSWSNVFGWGGEANAYKLVNKGYNIILSSATNLYLDLAYNKDPDEIGYYWAGFVDTKKCFYYRPLNIYQCMLHDRMGNKIDQNSFKDMETLKDNAKGNILGMQGLLWGENSKGQEILEYQSFPKLLGVAERAWNMKMPEIENMDREWAIFSSVLGHYILPYLDYLNVNYRIPLPGAMIENNILSINIIFRGLVLQYSVNQGKSWKEYDDENRPVVEGEVLIRALNSTKTRSSRIATVKC